jgi:hypothetical protein
VDTGGRCFPDQTCLSPGSPHHYPASDEETAGPIRPPRRRCPPANLFSHRLPNLMAVPDSGSRLGATMSAQVRIDAVIVTAGRFLTSPDTGFRSPVTRRPVCCRHSRRGSNRFEVSGATLQTAVILSWPGATVPGCRTSPRIRQKIANATEKAVLRASSGPYRRDCSSAERRISRDGRDQQLSPYVTALPEKRATLSMTLVG